jgi:hypothetical protein
MKKREESYMPDSVNILFVYNLDSGVLQSLHDYSRSRAAPSGEDACNLSTITHSPVGMKKEWKRFIKDMKIPSRSLARNDFFAEFGHRTITFPIVLLKKGPELSVLISTEELNRCKDLSDLISLVGERISPA